MRVRLRQLRTLVAVADVGSFAAAAERLSLTQAAVSMQMKALEDGLAVSLFDRSMRPPVLTGTGRTVVERAREIIALSDDLSRELPVAGQPFGLLNIGVVPGASLGLLPDALVRLRDSHPGVQVRVTSGLSSELMQRVAHGELDAAVVTEPARLEQDLECRTICEEALLVIVPPAEGARSGRSDAELLESLPYVAFNRQAEMGRIIDAGLRDRGLVVDRAMELDSLDAIVMMVARGLGASIVGERSVYPRYAGEVVALPFGSPVQSRRIGVVRRARQRDTAMVDALSRELRAVAASQGPTGSPVAAQHAAQC